MPDENDPAKMPENQAGKWGLVVAKAAASFIPFAGGPAAEVLGALIQPQIEKRTTVWLEGFAREVIELSHRVDGLTPERLSQSPEFTTAFLHASQIALRTHQQEQLAALRNAVLNVAVGKAPDEDLQTVFLALIDSLTPWHLKLLAFLNDPMGYMAQNGLVVPGAPAAKGSNLIGYVFPTLPVRDALPSVYLVQLVNQGLLREDWDEQLPYKHPDLRGASRTTPFGKQFLAFITSPIAEEQDQPTEPARSTELQ